ncbi:hypothetical protein LTR16_006162, partial [Cryomyces antarcticus]
MHQPGTTLRTHGIADGVAVTNIEHMESTLCVMWALHKFGAEALNELLNSEVIDAQRDQAFRT